MDTWDMWEKIVLNLISNAFKYTLEGRIQIALRVEKDSAVLSVWRIPGSESQSMNCQISSTGFIGWKARGDARTRAPVSALP